MLFHMARDESDREDLLREATALVERIELSLLASGGHSVVIGFRANGAVSIFFGSDPVYQFNAAGELRRAYCDGLLFKARQHRLISLRRVRQPDQVQLVSHDQTDAEQRNFMNRMKELLRDLVGDLEYGRYRVVGQVPAEADVLQRVRDWLAAHDEPPIAATPRVV
jgi:hypothetical protein